MNEVDACIELSKAVGPCTLFHVGMNYTYLSGDYFYKVAQTTDETRLLNEYQTTLDLIKIQVLPERLDPHLVSFAYDRVALRLLNLKDSPELTPEEEGKSLARELRRVQDLPVPSDLAPKAGPEFHLTSQERYPRPRDRETDELHTFLYSIQPEQATSLPLVLTHGDLNRGNYVPSQSETVIIDWEYAKMAPRAWDPLVILINGWNKRESEDLLRAFYSTYGSLDPDEVAWCLPQIVGISASWAHFQRNNPAYTQSVASRLAYWDWYVKNPEELLSGTIGPRR